MVVFVLPFSLLYCNLVNFQTLWYKPLTTIKTTLYQCSGAQETAQEMTNCVCRPSLPMLDSIFWKPYFSSFKYSLAKVGSKLLDRPEHVKVHTGVFYFAQYRINCFSTETVKLYNFISLYIFIIL